MTNVISMKDWVPGWVRDSYLTEAEIDAFNQEFPPSQLALGAVENTLDNQEALLVEKAVTKLESIDRDSLEKWLQRLPAELLVELVED